MSTFRLTKQQESYIYLIGNGCEVKIDLWGYPVLARPQYTTGMRVDAKVLDKLEARRLIQWNGLAGMWQLTQNGHSAWGRIDQKRKAG
jgi:hypothetical protein